MQNDGPFWQGYNAAKDGKPSSTCPLPKPDKLPRGEAYPGDWCIWLSGWVQAADHMSKDATQERAQMYRMTIEVLR